MANNSGLELEPFFEKFNDDGTTTVFKSQQFGIRSVIPAMHFAMDKQTFAEYYYKEIQRASDEMMNAVMKEWEKQNGK